VCQTDRWGDALGEELAGGVVRREAEDRCGSPGGGP
jgi:hypothetical protein